MCELTFSLDAGAGVGCGETAAKWEADVWEHFNQVIFKGQITTK